MTMAMARGIERSLLAPGKQAAEQSRGVTWLDPGGSVHFWASIAGFRLAAPGAVGLCGEPSCPLGWLCFLGVPPHLLVMAGQQHDALELCWSPDTA